MSRLTLRRNSHPAQVCLQDRSALAGVADFVRQALEAGARVGTIAGTCSTPEERLHEAALRAIGPGLAEQMRVFSLGEASSISKGADDDGPGGRGPSRAAQEDADGRELSMEAQFSMAKARVRHECHVSLGRRAGVLQRCPTHQGLDS